MTAFDVEAFVHLMNTYARAWKLLESRLDAKTGWGKRELRELMLTCFIDAGNGGHVK